MMSESQDLVSDHRARTLLFNSLLSVGVLLFAREYSTLDFKAYINTSANFGLQIDVIIQEPDVDVKDNDVGEKSQFFI